MSKATKGIIAAVVVIVIVGGGFVVWDRVLRDKSDAPANVNAIGGSGGASGSTMAGSMDGASGTPDGTWTLQQGDTVFVGYRVHEIFAQGAIEKTANGRTPAVTGSLTVADGQVTAVEINADVTRLKSDEQRRDGAIANRGLETAKFPEASFTLTSPLALGTPEPNKELTVTAKGDLTLHGQTKPVEVPLVAVWTGSEIKVATQGEGLPIQFADFGIEAPSVPGFVTTDDHGTLELQLLFTRG